MSDTFDRVRTLVARGEILLSSHGYDELAVDGILLADIRDGANGGIVLEDYPSAFKGPSVLVLQHDRLGVAIHVLWGIPAGKDGPATIVTAYRPNPARWTPDFRRRVR